jgi:ketosteroid isomerase-like protein
VYYRFLILFCDYKNSNSTIMFKKISFIIIALIGFQQITMAQSKDEKAVAAALEQLRAAMVDGDSTKLTNLTSAELSYGHSGGHVEGQAEFVHKIVSGKSDFVTIDITEQTINIVKDIAVVRHTFHATTNDNGKTGEVDLNILLVWQKDKKEWKLLARQAVKAKPKS